MKFRMECRFVIDVKFREETNDSTTIVSCDTATPSTMCILLAAEHFLCAAAMHSEKDFEEALDLIVAQARKKHADSYNNLTHGAKPGNA